MGKHGTALLLAGLALYYVAMARKLSSYSKTK